MDVLSVRQRFVRVAQKFKVLILNGSQRIRYVSHSVHQVSHRPMCFINFLTTKLATVYRNFRLTIFTQNIIFPLVFFVLDTLVRYISELTSETLSLFNIQQGSLYGGPAHGKACIYTAQRKHIRSTNVYPCHEWDCNPRFHCSRGPRQDVPQTRGMLCSFSVHKRVFPH